MRTTMILILSLLGACACGTGWSAEGDVSLNGTFIWPTNKTKDFPIQSVFTPAGEKKWTVVFSFIWDKGQQTWKGTAEGDLKTGEVKGEGFHPNGKRNFTFSGTFTKEGVLNCTHNEVIGGKLKATGTMILKKG